MGTSLVQGPSGMMHSRLTHQLSLTEPHCSPSAAPPPPAPALARLRACHCSEERQACLRDLVLSSPGQAAPLIRGTAAASRHSLLSMLPCVLLQARQQDKAELICPPPAIWKPVPLWTGKQVSSNGLTFRVVVSSGSTLHPDTRASCYPATA